MTVAAEATGATVAEARRNALRELERLDPSLDPASVRFEVLAEGRPGLLGVGALPARVVATATGSSLPAAADGSEQALRLHELVERVTVSLRIGCRVQVTETADTLTATCSGGDLALLIGRHGQTIDALQTLASAILRQDDATRKTVVVDAAGYRDRRRRSLESLAVRGAQEALHTGSAVALEPMSAAERRIVHERLKAYDGVQTSSEGDEPDRHVVVSPVA